MYAGAIAKRRARMHIDEIIDNFSLLEEWDDRYRYVIELGRTLTPLSPDDHVEAHEWMDTVERLRDPSHARFISPNVWRKWCVDAGLTVTK